MLSYLRTRSISGSHAARQAMRLQIEQDFPSDHIHYKNESESKEYLTHWNNHDYLSGYHLLYEKLHKKIAALLKIIKEYSHIIPSDNHIQQLRNPSTPVKSREAAYQATLIKVANMEFDNDFAPRLFYIAFMSEVTTSAGTIDLIQDLIPAHAPQSPNLLHDLEYANYQIFERAFYYIDSQFFKIIAPLYQAFENLIEEPLNRMNQTWAIANQIVYGQEKQVILLIECLSDDWIVSLMDITHHLIYEQRHTILTALLKAYRRQHPQPPDNLINNQFLQIPWQAACYEYTQNNAILLTYM